jgi:antitoxin MazE
MKAKLARWGNSLALRLPAEVVRDFGLKEGQAVELEAKKPNLEIKTERPVVNGIPVYTLEELVAEMKRLGPENRPELVDWGPDVGAEIIDDDYSRGLIGPGSRGSSMGGSQADKRPRTVRRAARRRAHGS